MRHSSFLLRSAVQRWLSRAAEGSSKRQEQVESNLLKVVQIENEVGEKQSSDIRSKMRQFGITGCSVSVLHNGLVDWHADYGSFENKQGLANVVQAGALAKTVTLGCVSRALKDGLIPSLDVPVNSLLRHWKIRTSEALGGQEDQDVTIRDILTHTAGTSVHYFAGYRSTEPRMPTSLEILSGQPPALASEAVVRESAVGSKFQYSDGGYMVLQYLLEETYKAPFSKIAKDLVLDPLQMSHSSLSHRWTHGDPIHYKEAILAQPHDNLGLPITTPTLFPQLSACGLWSTVGDISKLVLSLQEASGAPGISQRSAASSLIWGDNFVNEEMFRYQRSRVPHNGWGLGLWLFGKEESLGYKYIGIRGGYTAMYFGIVGQPKAVVVTTNAHNGMELTLQIVRSVARTYEWPGTDFAPLIKRIDHAVDADHPVSFDGEYEFVQDPRWPTVKIRKCPQTKRLLYTHPSEFREVPLRASGSSSFFSSELGTEITFVSEQDAGLIYQEKGMSFKMRLRQPPFSS